MIFVNRVVTVHRITSDKVAEAEVDPNIVSLAQSDNVLASALDQRGRISVSLQNLMFLEVNMNWMRPIASALEFPDLSRISLDSETNIVAVKEFAVDYPLSILTVELEATRDAFSHARRNLVEGRIGSRVNAVVCYRIRDDAKLKHLIPLTCRKNIVSWSCAIALLQPILKMNDASCCERREVNNHVHALSNSDHQAAGRLHRILQEVAIVGNYPEGLICKVRLG